MCLLCDNHSRDDLLKAEIYTLGFIFAFLVRGPHTLNKLRSASPGDIAKLKKQGELANWILQDEELLLLNRMIRPTFGEDAAERETLTMPGPWHVEQKVVVGWQLGTVEADVPAEHGY